jgi:hypothetical protein
MVPLWQHIVVILCLLTSNLLTAYFATRAIRRLRYALTARRAIFGEPDPNALDQRSQTIPHSYPTKYKATYGGISPAIAGYMAARMLKRAAPKLKLDAFGKTYTVSK